MTELDEGLIRRAKYAKGLETSNRFGDWSLDKYKENLGWVVFHWPCGRWTMTFWTHQQNKCAHCLDQTPYPEKITSLYTLLNFDLMSSTDYNNTMHQQRRQ